MARKHNPRPQTPPQPATHTTPINTQNPPPPPLNRPNARHITQLRRMFGFPPGFICVRRVSSAMYACSQARSARLGRLPRPQLCARWGKVRALASERIIAYGLSHGRFPLFLDFGVMWLAGYFRGLFLERWGRWDLSWRGADRPDPYQTVRNPPVPKTNKSDIWAQPVALALEVPARLSPNGMAVFIYKWRFRTVRSLYDHGEY